MVAKLVLVDHDYGNASRPIGVPNPTASDHAANKAYVDSAIEGLAWKDSARVATQANVNLSSPGASVDGVTMVAGDRVLVRSQTAQAENGIYIWNGSSTAMSRAADCSTADELEQATTTVEEGTSAGATYRQTAVNLTLGTTAVTWTAFGTAAGAASESTAGILEIATQGETDTGTDDQRALTPAKAKAASWMLRKYATDIGDGSATQYTATHNLNTRDVHVSVRRNSGNYDEVECLVEVMTVNTVRLTFNQAPTSNQYRVIVQG